MNRRDYPSYQELRELTDKYGIYFYYDDNCRDVDVSLFPTKWEQKLLTINRKFGGEYELYFMRSTYLEQLGIRGTEEFLEKFNFKSSSFEEVVEYIFIEIVVELKF